MGLVLNRYPRQLIELHEGDRLIAQISVEHDEHNPPRFNVLINAPPEIVITRPDRNTPSKLSKET